MKIVPSVKLRKDVRVSKTVLENKLYNLYITYDGQKENRYWHFIRLSVSEKDTPPDIYLEIIDQGNHCHLVARAYVSAYYKWQFYIDMAAVGMILAVMSILGFQDRQLWSPACLLLLIPIGHYLSFSPGLKSEVRSLWEDIDKLVKN